MKITNANEKIKKMKIEDREYWMSEDFQGRNYYINECENLIFKYYFYLPT